MEGFAFGWQVMVHNQMNLGREKKDKHGFGLSPCPDHWAVITFSTNMGLLCPGLRSMMKLPSAQHKWSEWDV